MNTDLVSIITPVFNSAHTIGETLTSVLQQTYQNWEAIVVIDEGTHDNTAQVVSQFDDKRIRLCRFQGKGLAASRNFGVSQAQGRWLCFLDADDLWLPPKLSTQIDWTSKLSYPLTCHAYRRIQDSRVGRLICPPDVQGYHDVLANNRIPFFSSLIDRTQVKLPEFQERPQEDWVFWLDLLKQNKIECSGLAVDLGRYRVVSNSRSARDPRLRSRWEILREREKISLPLSVWYYSSYLLTAVTKRMVF